MTSSQPNLLRCVVGWVTNPCCEMHNTDNNPYDPGVGIDADIDFLPLKEF